MLSMIYFLGTHRRWEQYVRGNGFEPKEVKLVCEPHQLWGVIVTPEDEIIDQAHTLPSNARIAVWEELKIARGRTP